MSFDDFDVFSRMFGHFCPFGNVKAPKEFEEHKTGASKIRFCLKELQDTNDLPSGSTIFQAKNDAASINARNLGNRYFKQRDYVQALECYNQSICLAPMNSENLGIGYANRAAVFLNSGFYKLCLQNIEFAEANNYPEKFKKKLELRKKECLKAIEEGIDSQEKFDKEYAPLRMTYPAKKSNPCIAEGIELGKSAAFGRHVYTKRELKPGDVILIEKPYAKHLVKDAVHTRCANCLDQCYMNVFPCSRCTKAMFCSQKCHEIAHKRWHKYECPIIDGIFDIGTNSNFNQIETALRAALQSLTLFDDPHDLGKLMKEIANKNEVFEVNYAKLTEKNHFRAIYSLSTNETKATSAELYQYARECARAWHLLSKHTFLPFLLKTKETQDIFLDLLFHFFQSTIVNAHSLGLASGNLAQYGSAIFALASLFNHSCVPNVGKIFDKSVIRIVAKRVIKAGEQLFDCYDKDVHHGHANLQKRQRKLKSQYRFECKCKACRNDFPLLEQMPTPKNQSFAEKVINDLHQMQNYDKEFAKKKLKEYKKYLIQYDKKVSSFELYSSEDVFMQALWTVMFGRPLHLQLKHV
ncbi:SET and MYND domain-containing protein 4-like [Culicoides brevitarsis]|uniref:SET and MYND domain-containing protein 4-like n=1 Tax=Culicoides brevitarsis TaxID=469753 RepID=UPI00307B2B3E